MSDFQRRSAMDLRTPGSGALVTQSVAATMRSPEQLIEELSRYLSQAGNEPARNGDDGVIDDRPHARSYTIDDDEIDDTPMPIPSTWRVPFASDRKRERGWLREHFLSAALGLVAGLMVVVPTATYLTSEFGLAERFGLQHTDAGVLTPAVAHPRRVASAFAEASGVAIPPTGTNSPKRATAPATSAENADPVPIQTVKVRALPSVASVASKDYADGPNAQLPPISMARAKISEGDLPGARRILAQLASAGDLEALFALAETYDPNILAAWRIKDVKADAGKARLFYGMAFSGGHSAARQRLSALD